MAPLRVRSLRPDDLAWASSLQRAALPHGFFTRLGPRFLRAYQRTFVDSPYAIALVAEDGGSPLGFLVGVTDPALHRSWIVRRRRVRLGLFGAFCLLAHPRELARFLGTRIGHYAHALTRRGTPRRRYAPAAVLTHLAVSPERRRGGAGRRLAEAFVAEARRRGAVRVRLTTLDDDRGAEGFWLSLGWTPGELVPDDEGRLHRVFEREL